MYAITMTNLDEFATLRALGASRFYIARVVLLQGLICGLIGCILSAIITFPLTSLARLYIPWAEAFGNVIVIIAIPSLLMCELASLTPVTAALNVEPGRVFRA